MNPQLARDLLGAIWDRTPERLILIDRKRRVLDVNRQVHGPREELLGRPIEELFSAAQRAPVSEAIEGAFARNVETVFEPSSSSLEAAETHALSGQVIPLGGAATGLALLRCTPVDRGRVENAELLREAAIRAQRVVEYLPDVAVIADRERRILWVNRLPPSLTLDQVLGERVEKFGTPDMQARIASAIDEVFRSGQATRYEATSEVLDGTLRMISTLAVPMPKNGALEQVLLLTTDITTHRQAEQALSKSETYLEQVLQAGEIGLWEWDPGRGSVKLGALWAQVTGDPSEAAEITLEAFYAAIVPEDRERVRAALEGVLLDGRSSFELEYRVCARDAPGEERWLLHRGRPARRVDERDSVGDSARILGTLLDVTKRRADEQQYRRLREHLERAQRLESIEQLAGGIAHDFNNLLLVVLSQADLARRILERGGDPNASLSHIKVAAERAAALTRKLLAFSRQQAVDAEVLSIDAHLAALMPLLRGLVPENIELVRQRSDADPHWVLADPGQLEQVILNLCLNARDAMASGGTITIESARVVLTAGDFAEHEKAVAGPFVAIRVRDTGVGIDHSVRERMFEPFFTTKPAGRGTGLGLSVSDGIVRKHGGLIRVHSAPSQGTTLEVLLPEASSVQAASPKPESDRAPTGNETVLVAEDEAMVRSLVTQILTQAGYRVLQACDGREAVKLFVENRDAIDLVMLDAVMPNLDGRGAYEQIRAISISVPFLFSSGYSAEHLPADLLRRDRLPMLAKPYSSADLLRAVRAALERSN